ncbi:MAG: hypothetical protein N3G20_06135 [Verrucomicrobiae bacterium]|nr:hypothetical protein [Verrucomicrobiae bacterium]
MNGLLDKLNLTAQERRIAVVFTAITFVVLNALFVWPHFGDLAKLRVQLEAARKTLDTYKAEIAKVPAYRARLEALERQGEAVLAAEQALQLTRTVQNQAQLHNVVITGTRPVTSTSTNQFFDEQALSIDVTATDKELVDFLVALGSGNSMIRVRDMDLRPDPAQYKLLGKITLVASYQKKPKLATPSPSAPAAPRSRTNLPSVTAKRQ